MFQLKFVRPFVFAAVAVGVAIFLVASPSRAQTSNLALNKPATASSIEGSSYTAAKAVDGSTSTRWASVDPATSSQWIYVDLGATTSISRVVLKWEAAYAKSYQVQVSDNASTWTSIYSTTTGNGATDDLTGLSGSGRYVRVYCTVRGTSWGYSLWEFEVYGTSGPTSTPTFTPTVTSTPSCEVTLSGQVYDAVDGPTHGIGGAHVVVQLSVPRTFEAVTDGGGYYTLLVPGTYCSYVTGLEANATGYQSQSLVVTIADLLAQPIRNFALTPLSPSPTPTMTPTTCAWQYGTASLGVNPADLTVGQVTTVSVGSSGLGMPQYTVSVDSVVIAQYLYNASTWTIITSTTPIVRAEVSTANPAVLWLRAVQPGTAQISLSVSGEIGNGCGSWMWSSAGAGPMAVNVTTNATATPTPTPTNTPTFTPTPTTCPAITGFVRLGSSTGPGLAGVQITGTDSGGTITGTTGSTGFYVLGGCGRYGMVVTPQLAGYTFTPAQQTYSGTPLNFIAVTVTPTNTATLPPSSNLALNKPATASSIEGSSYTAAKAVDGSTSTRWASAEGSDPQWIYVDLQATTTISRVVLKWEAAYGKSYQIQVSDNASTWTSIYSTTTGNGATDDLTGLSGSGRYVRMYGTQRGTSWGYSLWEFEVYGSGGPTSTPTNTPTRTNTPSLTNTPTKTNTPTTTPTSSGSDNFPSRFSAPYVETWNNTSVNSLANSTGHKFYTLAFIISNGSCTATWNGDTALSSNLYVSDLALLRAQGGDVIISFGGASGTELGQACSSVSALQAAYQSVITKYSLKWMDMDIESGSESDTTSVTRRNQALAALQTANPGLKVSYTLAVDRTGLPSAQIALLNNAKANGVRVDVVNIMAMDYGPCYTDMGQAAIDAAVATRSQLSSNGISAAVGVTPMIGVNDVTCENFTTTNSQQLVTYAQSNSYISLLAYWAIGADSGYSHLNIFKTFN